VYVVVQKETTLITFGHTGHIDILMYAPIHVSQVFDDVNDQLWFHNTLFNDIINKHAPVKKRMIRSRQLPLSLKRYFEDRCYKADNRKPGQFWDTIKPFIYDNSKSTTDINLRCTDL
jgi:hypothetical protein